MSQPLLLASQSAIRAKLLRQAGLRVEIVPAGLDERSVEDGWRADGLAPHSVAVQLAEAKALAVSRQRRDHLVLGADQTLALGATRFDKAKDRAGALSTLQHLRGQTHQLHAAFALAKNDTILASDVSTARLTMRPLSDAALETYLDQAGDTVLASVGCYQVEGLGITLFSSIEGDYFTVLGLPLLKVLEALRHVTAGSENGDKA